MITRLYVVGWYTAVLMIFFLFRKLLSRQQHYDWGLRALKSVLQSAGDALAGRSSSIENDSSEMEKLEYTAVVRALNLNTLSKLTMADSKLFLNLVADIFPTVQNYTDPAHGTIIETITECCNEMGLTVLDRQVFITWKEKKVQRNSRINYG